MKYIIFVVIFLIVVGVGVTIYRSYRSAPVSPEQSTRTTEAPRVRKTYTAFPGVLPEKELQGRKVRIVTEKGDIVIVLFGAEAPKTVSNFLALTSDGFYDGLTFHRREEGFVIQGGDPNGNGMGGPGYRFEDEPVKRSYTRGIVAMANAGPNTNGSQFFIMLGDVPLPPLYTIFGEVESGMDVVDRIRVGDVMERVRVE